MNVCAAAVTWRSENSFWVLVSPSTTWDLGTELRSSGSAASTFGGLIAKPQLLLMQTDGEFWVLLLHFHRWLLQDFILCGGLGKNGPTSPCI